MTRPQRPFIRPLLLVLILAVGPVQAETLFACAMMDAVIEQCCCDDHAPCADSDCGDTLDSKADPCCETSVELRVNPASDESSAVIKPVEVRSDVDPPPAVLVDTLIVAPINRSITIVSLPDIYPPRHSGTDTYLVTQRLRI